MGLARQSLLWASRQQWLGRQVQQRAFTRRAAARFMPGEDLESALTAMQSFRDHGIANLITLLGENVSTEADATAVTQSYLDAMSQIRARELDCQVSVKPTQLGLDTGRDACAAQLSILAAAAAEQNDLLWIDMESSAYVDATLALAAELGESHGNVGVCIQAYLHRSAADLERLVANGTPVRLVKGAYKEPASVAIQRKSDVDLNYSTLAMSMIESLVSGASRFHAFGTHDVELIHRIQRFASEKGLSQDRYEFEMLYGIRREHQLELASAGYGMRVLISYGTSWFPWYMRRLAERPANVWFVVKSLIRR